MSDSIGLSSTGPIIRDPIWARGVAAMIVGRGIDQLAARPIEDVMADWFPSLGDDDT